MALSLILVVALSFILVVIVNALEFLPEGLELVWVLSIIRLDSLQSSVYAHT